MVKQYAKNSSVNQMVDLEELLNSQLSSISGILDAHFYWFSSPPEPAAGIQFDITAQHLNRSNLKIETR